MLQGEDLKRAQEFSAKIDDHMAAGHREGAAEVVERLLALREGLQGTDHWEVADARRTLGDLRNPRSAEQLKRLAAAKLQLAEFRAHFAKGRYAEALPLAEASLNTNREIAGVKHPDTAASMNGLAQLYQSQGRLAEAEPLFREALAIRHAALGGNHPAAATSKNNLAVLYEAQGRHAEAEPLYREALGVRSTVLGGKHPETAQSMNNLAGLYRAHGRHAEAEPLFREALEINRAALGGNHPDTAQSMNNLAGLYQAQGRQAEAEPLFRKAMEIYRAALGANHPRTAIAMNNLAALYLSQGRHAEAESHFRQALEVRRAAFGGKHLDTASGLNNLAALCSAQGRYTEAEPLYREALTIARATLGDIHATTATGLNNLGKNYAHHGRYAEAEPLLREAVRVYRATLGGNHLSTAAGLNSLAALYQSQGRLAEAELLYRESLEVRRAILGDKHPDTSIGQNNLAALYEAQGRHAEAEPFFREALLVRRAALGSKHATTAQSMNNLAALYRSQGRLAEAEPLFHEALRVYRATLGGKHPETATTLSNLALLFNDQSRYAEAESLNREALAVRRAALGGKHPDTASCLMNLAAENASQGRYTEAELLLREAAAAYEASRWHMARGLDRASWRLFNPHIALAALLAKRAPAAAAGDWEASLARSLLDEEAERRRAVDNNAEVADITSLKPRLGQVNAQIMPLATKLVMNDSDRRTLEELIRTRQGLEDRLSDLSAAASRRLVAQQAAIRGALKTGQALLGWIDIDAKFGDIQQHWACVIRPLGEPVWVRLPGTGPDSKWEKTDGGLARTLVEALKSKGPPSDIDSAVRRLRVQRIAPVLPHLEGVTTLFVVGVEEIAGVPVELLTPEVTISYIPSGTVLARLKDRPPPKGDRLLALGDPVLPPPTSKPAAEPPLPPGGLLITAVTPGGVAAKAGVEANDVLLKYAGTELKAVEELGGLIQKNAGETSVPAVIWRDDKELNRALAPGRLGVALDKEPAPTALAARRRLDTVLAKLSRGGTWAELPGTAVEVENLRQLLPECAAVLTRSDASEQRLDELCKAGDLTKYRYLHFATHGEANDAVAFESALILAQDELPRGVEPELGKPFLNGQLSAREVLDHWTLDAELVTLSACETAVGAKGGGDGLLGFAQAFLTAGARAVCLSLWKVDDQATALLMDRFYRNLLGQREGLHKPIGKAAALAEAKKWLRELTEEEATARYATLSGGVDRAKGKVGLSERVAAAVVDGVKRPFADPRYWAAFILIGDPN